LHLHVHKYENQTWEKERTQKKIQGFVGCAPRWEGTCKAVCWSACALFTHLGYIRGPLSDAAAAGVSWTGGQAWKITGILPTRFGGTERDRLWTNLSGGNWWGRAKAWLGPQQIKNLQF